MTDDKGIVKDSSLCFLVRRFVRRPFLSIAVDFFWSEDDVNRIAIIGIIVDDYSAAEQVNAVLHEYGSFVVGRMGIPYKDRGVNVISVIVDAPADVINVIGGKLGAIKGVSAKSLFK